MKKTSRIPLNETREIADDEGNNRVVNLTRTVADEVKRLRDSGMEVAAQRLENSCDDHIAETDVPIPESILGTGASPRKK